MKQTEKLKLNLLEGEDRIPPRPLNENMEKVEAAFLAADAALLNAVGSGGKNARVASGGYVGDGTFGEFVSGESYPNRLTFDFVPMAVLVGSGDSGILLINPMPSGVPLGAAHTSGPNSYPITVTWGDKAVSWVRGGSAEYQLNAADTTYYWVAVGYGESQEE